MKINNYIRYIIGIYLGWLSLTFVKGTPSIFNYCMFGILSLVIVIDLIIKNRINNKK